MNAPQVQLLTEMGAVLVAAGVGWVAWKQTLAADAQTRAADRQTVAADQQTAAAQAQVQAAMKQIEASLLIADRQTAPSIEVTAAKSDGPNSIDFQNLGFGTALSIRVRYQDDAPGYDELRLSHGSLAPRDNATVTIDPTRAAQSGLRFSYETMFGTKYVLEFQWTGGEAVNMRLAVS